MVEGREIKITEIDDRDYISLSDMAREEGGINRIQNWMRNRDTIEFLAAWEEIHNPDFNVVQMHNITQEAGLNRFLMSPQQWKEETNAIGILSKRGRYGGVFAHKDIAYHFAMWLAPRFSLLVIKEFERLKEEEYSQRKMAWNYQRFLSKVNYKIHTETIRDHIIPALNAPKSREWIVYANEADLLNMAVFGQTAKQWREANPELARSGNQRDFASIVELNIMANLESLNSVLIEQHMPKEKRFELLARTAVSQYGRLIKQQELKKLDD